MKYLRVLKPSGKHLSYRFQFLEQDKWKTLHTETIDTLNQNYRTEVISQADANVRAEAILAQLYMERDRGTKGVAAPGNLKLMKKFIAEVYDSTKVRRIYKKSHMGGIRRLERAMNAIGVIPIDGDVEPLQEHIDKLFTGDKHEKVVMCCNRIRKWLGIKLLQHLRDEIDEVEYVTLEQFLDGLEKCPDPERTVAAVAFYAGLRPSEILGLQAKDIRGDVLSVDRQIQGGLLQLPKNRKKRKAFVMADGLPWVMKWMSMDKVYDPAVIKQHFGIHLYGLRHSYAVHLIGQGATLDWIAQSMGNSREVCERHYVGHIISTDSLDALRRLQKKG